MVWVEELEEAIIFEKEDAACTANANFVDEGKDPNNSNPNLNDSSSSQSQEEADSEKLSRIAGRCQRNVEQ